MHTTNTILFIPVSQPLGSGEYYRCASLAQSLRDVRPDLDIHICANREARVQPIPGVQLHYFEDSPTHCTSTVNALINQLQPGLVFFDNSLRLEQLKAAKNGGAATVFLSSRPKKRRVGFSPRKMKWLDEHWIVASTDQHSKGPLESVVQKVNRDRTTLRFFSTLQPLSDSRRRDSFLAENSFSHSGYVLFAPGGGTGEINGMPTSALFQEAARSFEKQTGAPVILIAGPASDIELESSSTRLEMSAVSPEVFVDLIDGSSIFVTGGGSQLWQALAMNKACLAIPTLGKEQPARLKGLHRQNVIDTCERNSRDVARGATELYFSPQRQKELQESTKAQGYRQGLEEARKSIIHQLTGGT